MPQVSRVIALPATGGAPVVVRCTRLTSRMEIQESSTTSAGMQGIEYSLLTPTGFGKYTVGPVIDVPPSQSLEPIVVAGYPGDHPPNTVPIGNGGSGGQPVGPGGPATQGTVVFQATSASGSVTSIVVTEWF